MPVHRGLLSLWAIEAAIQTFSHLLSSFRDSEGRVPADYIN